eukprot:354064-Chlamydomonas_euryale.AAC.5
MATATATATGKEQDQHLQCRGHTNACYAHSSVPAMTTIAEDHGNPCIEMAATAARRVAMPHPRPITHTHTQARTHARTHTRTHAHTHACTLTLAANKRHTHTLAAEETNMHTYLLPSRPRRYCLTGGGSSTSK